MASKVARKCEVWQAKAQEGMGNIFKAYGTLVGWYSFQVFSLSVIATYMFVTWMKYEDVYEGSDHYFPTVSQIFKSKFFSFGR